jgi:chromosome condensin MukBEF complex kleisin-like MukF subunit
MYENPKRQTIDEAVTKAYSSNFNLFLDIKQAAFLIGIYVFIKYSTEPSLNPGDLQNIFSRVNTLIGGEEETIEIRCSNAINHLRNQELIGLVSGLGGKEYVLTTLGRAISDHWENKDLMTQQSLVAYTNHVYVALSGIREDVKRSKEDPAEAEMAAIKLREIVPDIINNIDRRQQGMAKAQKKIEKMISEKLSADWSEATEACEEMLRTTGTALEELHTIMLSQTDLILAVLDEISDYAQINRHMLIMNAAQSIHNQMETIRQWSNTAHEDWSQYYKNVHDFIRRHVRVDPKRQAAERIQTAIREFSSHQWTIAVPDPPPFYNFRVEEFTPTSEPIDITGLVSRPPIEDTKPADRNLVKDIIKEVKSQIAATGSASLITILQKMMPGMNSAQLYSASGELVTILAEYGIPVSNMVVDWHPLTKSIAIQDLTVLKEQ